VWQIENVFFSGSPVVRLQLEKCPRWKFSRRGRCPGAYVPRGGKCRIFNAPTEGGANASGSCKLRVIGRCTHEADRGGNGAGKSLIIYTTASD